MRNSDKMTIKMTHPTVLSKNSISIPVSTVISKCDGTSSVETNFSWSVWIWRTFSLVKSSSKKLSEFKCSEFCNSLLSLYLIIKWRESYHEFYTAWIMNGYVAEDNCSKMQVLPRNSWNSGTCNTFEPQRSFTQRLLNRRFRRFPALFYDFKT